MKQLCLIVLIKHYVTMLYENNAKSVNATYLFRFFVIQLIVKFRHFHLHSLFSNIQMIYLKTVLVLTTNKQTEVLCGVAGVVP